MAILSEGLPTLPGYVFELNGLLNSSPVNLKRAGEVIRTDPSLSAQVLRVCNSALLNLRWRVTSIDHAVILLGAERLRTLVLTCSLVEYVGHRLSAADVQSFWQHSFLTALLSERIAKAVHYAQSGQAYMAGLLHDIGALPLLVISAKEKQRGDNSTSESWGEAVELERQRFGADHCEIGRWIGVSWSFSPLLLEVFEFHHQPREATLDPKLVGMVAAADQFCLKHGVCLGSQSPQIGPFEPAQRDELVGSCLPEVSQADRPRLSEMLESEFLQLIRLPEFCSTGSFGCAAPVSMA